jgi:hypothetical protein
LLISATDCVSLCEYFHIHHGLRLLHIEYYGADHLDRSEAKKVREKQALPVYTDIKACVSALLGFDDLPVLSLEAAV